MKKLKSFLVYAMAYDNTWKTDEDGNLVLKDGNPVYVDSNGDERAVKVDVMSRLSGEAKANRERAEAAEAKIKAFDGLDAEAARSALEKVSNLDEKTLIAAGDRDKALEDQKAKFIKELEAKDRAIAEGKDREANLQGHINKTAIEKVFTDSQFVKENVAAPELLRDALINRFKVEDGNVVGLDEKGEVIYSKNEFGEVASADEAIKIMLDGYHSKDAILKSSMSGGSGSDGSGGSRGTGRKMSRDDFAKLSPIKQKEVSEKVASGEMVLTE